MRVTKRNGELEEIAFDKILNRIRNLGHEASININYQQLVMKVIDQLYDTISTAKIDELAAEQCASMSTMNPDYGTLAGHIIVSNHHKNTDSVFSNVVEELYNFHDIHNVHQPLVSSKFADFVNKHKDELNAMIDYSRDYLIEYFGFKTLEKAYLFRKGKKVIERPQHMWLRVAIGIHGDTENPNALKMVKETYDLMSQKYFTHATPTLFNAGTPRPQMSSCYLVAMEDDSIEGIFNTLKDCANISKWAGGIGLHIHNIRGKGSHIQGTNGVSNGIVPMLRVFNNTARYVDQCVYPETIIYTTDGPIKIKNCSAGETCVFNVNGETEVIQNVLEHHYNGDMLDIKTEHTTQNLWITPEHPIYILSNTEKDISHDTLIQQLDKKLIDFEWSDASDLTTTDYIVHSIPQYSKDVESITQDDCFMYGLILEGGSMQCVHGNHPYVKVKGEALTEFVTNYLNNHFVKYRIKNVDNIFHKYTKFEWNQTINLPFRYIDFNDDILESFTEVQRPYKKWLNLPIEKSKYILKGLIMSLCDDLTTNELFLRASHYILTEPIRFLAMKLGSLTSKCTCYDNYGSHGSINHYIKVYKTKEICDLLEIEYNPSFCHNFFRYNNYLLTRITEINVKKYCGTVYDLQMEKEHNYMLNNGVVHNGGGRRKGSFAIYLEPWHPDIFDFLEMRKNHGDEEMKARDLFYALWVSDLFMERVKEKNGKWSLFCPHECPGLSDVYGDEFKALYEKYEQEGKARKTVLARDLWFAILDAQMETGTPYLLYKDAVNKKSNQKNIGTIKSSNLCTEIMQYSDKDETAVCNLASIALASFVDEKTKQFDYEKLHEVAKVVTNNLNKVIDVNFYPTEKTKRSNLRHRPVGGGVQGLADAFILMDIPFHSEEAKEVNKMIFETIYHASLEKSNELSIEYGEWLKEQQLQKVYGLFDKIGDPMVYDKIISRMASQSKHLGAYMSFEDSPASKGLLQFDLWNVKPSDRYDWAKLKESIMTYGLRNSLLLAPMPTASTSQILGFNECFEPFTSNLYSRRTLAGEFVVVNKYLMKELIQLGHWNEQIKNNIIANKGSVQQLSFLSEHVRNKYKIVWEIPMKHVIDMSADRGPFICQSQSLNLWMEEPVYNKLTSMHFYAWEKGLKTGIYYLRRKAKHQAQQFTIEPEHKEVEAEAEDICEMCSA